MKDVGKLEDPENRLIIKRLIKEIGEPRNYGLTDEEKAEEERRVAEEALAKEAAVKVARERKEAKERAEKIARWEEWVSARVWGLGLACAPLPHEAIEARHTSHPTNAVAEIPPVEFCLLVCLVICSILKTMPTIICLA